MHILFSGCALRFKIKVLCVGKFEYGKESGTVYREKF